MKPVIKPETINILGGRQEAGSSSNETSHFGFCHKQTVSEIYKSKIKKVWTGILNVAEDIKEKIIPVVVPTIKAVAGLLTAVAFFRNSKRKYAQKGGFQCLA